MINTNTVLNGTQKILNKSYSLMLQPLGRICFIAPFVPPILALVTFVDANISSTFRVVVHRHQRRIG